MVRLHSIYLAQQQPKSGRRIYGQSLKNGCKGSFIKTNSLIYFPNINHFYSIFDKVEVFWKSQKLLHLILLINIKSKRDIFPNFVAFSKYMNFNLPAIYKWATWILNWIISLKSSKMQIILEARQIYYHLLMSLQQETHFFYVSSFLLPSVGLSQNDFHFSLPRRIGVTECIL